MYISEIYTSGFRCFGPENPLTLKLRRGLNVLVGPNDSGKTAVIDAPRHVLWTRGDDFLRLEPGDFHVKPTGDRITELLIRCTFDELTPDEEARFLEWCSNEAGTLRLHVCLRATLRKLAGGGDTVIPLYRAGKNGDGPPLEGDLREYLKSTYLRPLRDAERELRSGRRSRLSRILGALPAMSTQADPAQPGQRTTLTDTMKQADTDVEANPAVQGVQSAVNTTYLDDLSFSGDPLNATLGLGVKGSFDQLLERLELYLNPPPGQTKRLARGLGYNNLLFMAAELLLLQSHPDQIPYLLIEEPEAHLHPHPSASAFLGYPHFIGTVTAFIDRFIALPYLHGLGWLVQRIDDDVFSAVAGSRWRSKAALITFSRMNNGANRHALEQFVSNMELADDFVCAAEVAPQRLKIRHRQRQPGPQSQSGIALEELKAEIVNDGFYRFADMTVLANQAIEKYPRLIERIRKRFPLVLLDEAQDTNGAQLALLDRLFGEGIAYQRLGDQNQTLYEDENLTPDDYWKAVQGVIPLNETQRFGTEIAAFSSRLTVRAAQQIEGVRGIPNRRSLILFDRDSIAGVLPAYAGEVRAHWGRNLPPNHDIRAVASRHNPTRDTTGEWPKTLIDYCPGYRSARGRQSRQETLCGLLRHASILHETSSSPAEIADVITTGIVDLLRRQDFRNVVGQAIGKRNLWAILASRDPGLPLKLRRLMRDHVVFGNSAWDAVVWEVFCRDLKILLSIAEPLAPAVGSFLEFVGEQAVDQDAQARQRSRTVFVHDDIPITLGSIHSVKGKSVDSILVLETEVWRGQALALRAMDLATVLPHALGLENRDFTANVAQLAAATNIFVAVTRPRQLLSCALRKEAANSDMIAAARIQGWHILDLTE